MPDLLRFDDQNQQRSSDFVIFTVASNFSLFFSASSSIDCCSFASDVHDHDSFVSQLTQPGILKVSEADRLSSFFDSYGLGIRMINGLEGLLLSSLDAKLTPKHLFRLCLEHEQKLNSSHKSAHAYNFYKDSNAPVMVKMVELLTILQQRIVFLLNECDDHPALQKIVDVIEMILAIPLSTPLAKALSGLQFLLNMVWCYRKLFQNSPSLLNWIRFLTWYPHGKSWNLSLGLPCLMMFKFNLRLMPGSYGFLCILFYSVDILLILLNIIDLLSKGTNCNKVLLKSRGRSSDFD